jgi:hypothetical protein
MLLWILTAPAIALLASENALDFPLSVRFMPRRGPPRRTHMREPGRGHHRRVPPSGVVIWRDEFRT